MMNDEVVGILQRALSDEAHAIIQYRLHALRALPVADVPFNDVAEHLKEHADAEEVHYKRIYDHLRRNGVEPKFEIDPMIHHGDSANDVVKAHQEAERGAIDTYTELLKATESDDLVETNQLAQDLLSDETEHLDDFTRYSDLGVLKSDQGEKTASTNEKRTSDRLKSARSDGDRQRFDRNRRINWRRFDKSTPKPSKPKISIFDFGKVTGDDLIDGFNSFVFELGVDHEIDFDDWKRKQKELEKEIDSRSKKFFEEYLQLYSKESGNRFGRDLTKAEQDKIRSNFDNIIRDFKKMYDEMDDSGKKTASTKEEHMSQELEFVSKKAALQHLADVTGKRIVIAAPPAPAPAPTKPKSPSKPSEKPAQPAKQPRTVPLPEPKNSVANREMQFASTEEALSFLADVSNSTIRIGKTVEDFRGDRGVSSEAGKELEEMLKEWAKKHEKHVSQGTVDKIKKDLE